MVLVLGSQNSSNSQRLAELARERGRRAHLIDGPGDVDLSWFQPDDVVLITAGASAPEVVVEQTIEHLKRHFDAAVEIGMVREEDVHFPLPRELRRLETAEQ